MRHDPFDATEGTRGDDDTAYTIAILFIIYLALVMTPSCFHRTKKEAPVPAYDSKYEHPDNP